MERILEMLQTWESLAKRWEELSRELEQSRDYWREKCEFYETLIRGEAI
jgi:hypothetical protein